MASVEKKCTSTSTVENISTPTTPTTKQSSTTTPIPILRNKIVHDNKTKYTTYAQAVIAGKVITNKNKDKKTTAAPSLRKKRVSFRLTSLSKRS